MGHYQNPLGSKIFEPQLASGINKEESSKRSMYRHRSRQSISGKGGSRSMKNDKEVKDRIKEPERRLSKPRVSISWSTVLYQHHKLVPIEYHSYQEVH